MNLAENKLHQVPHSVFRLKSLIKLDVAHNKLVTLSSAIGRLRSVTEINMAANCLEEIPKEIGEAVTLRKIDFSNKYWRSKYYKKCFNIEDQEEINAANAIASIMKNANTNSKGTASIGSNQSPE